MINQIPYKLIIQHNPYKSMNNAIKCLQTILAAHKKDLKENEETSNLVRNQLSAKASQTP